MQKRLMEPIIVEIRPNCSFEEDQPHQGRRVWHGAPRELYLYLGKERFRLKKGDCFMFKPNKTHVMKNTGQNSCQDIMDINTAKLLE